MKFGKHLKSHRTAAWAYIDYGALKKLLNKLVGDDQGSENRSENAEVSEELFWSRLTADVKAFDADVKRRVDFAKQHLLVGGAQLRPRLAAVVLLEIDRLEQYVNLNHEAVRKIVKKFVKKLGSSIDRSFSATHRELFVAHEAAIAELREALQLPPGGQRHRRRGSAPPVLVSLHAPPSIPSRSPEDDVAAQPPLEISSEDRWRSRDLEAGGEPAVTSTRTVPTRRSYSTSSWWTGTSTTRWQMPSLTLVRAPLAGWGHGEATKGRFGDMIALLYAAALAQLLGSKGVVGSSWPLVTPLFFASAYACAAGQLILAIPPAVTGIRQSLGFGPWCDGHGTGICSAMLIANLLAATISIASAECFLLAGCTRPYQPWTALRQTRFRRGVYVHLVCHILNQAWLWLLFVYLASTSSDEFGDAPLLSGISVFELVAGMVFGIPTDELQQLGFINNAGLGGVVNGSIVFGAELGPSEGIHG